jgi:hypothetical protein
MVGFGRRGVGTDAVLRGTRKAVSRRPALVSVAELALDEGN